MKYPDDIPDFKMATTLPYNRSEVLKHFGELLENVAETALENKFDCIDGSTLILLPKESEELVYVLFHCKLHVDPERKTMSFHSKNVFLTFCQKIGSEIMDMNNCKRIVLPASDGTLMSQIFTSRAWKYASHHLRNPKDKQIKGMK